MAWDYTGPDATFNLYGTDDMVHWSLLTNVAGQVVTVPLNGTQLFFVTATNEAGECCWPNVNTPGHPR